MIQAFALAAIGGLIFWLGSGRFGRSQTQAWIDRLRARPKVFAFFDRHHGAFRALAHYVEFGGLFLILYWCWDGWFGDGRFTWHPLRAGIVAAACALAAYLDEVHQLQSGSRQFRRVDFLYSLCGIAIAALIVCYQSVLRGL
ncbi:MAG: VanZ family protein [Sumerlaeia bacterium]